MDNDLPKAINVIPLIGKNPQLLAVGDSVFQKGCRKTEVFEMHEQKSLVLNSNVVVPESSLLQRERKDRYGGVLGLDDSELADPVELERQVLRQEFAPVLALPVMGVRRALDFDQDGCIDFGVGGTVKFNRTMPIFNKARYMADKVKEKIKDLVIRFSIVNAGINGKDKYRVLKQVNKGIIAPEHINNASMKALSRLFLRIQRLRQKLSQLREAGMKRQQQRTASRKRW